MISYNLTQEQSNVNFKPHSKNGGYYNPIHEVLSLERLGLSLHTYYSSLLDKFLNTTIRVIKRVNDSPDWDAIAIFKRLLFWFSPMWETNKNGDKTYKQKFKSNWLQKSYNQLAEEVGIDKRSVAAAVKRLCNRGLVFVKHLTSVNDQGDCRGNDTHFLLNIETIETLLEEFKTSRKGVEQQRIDRYGIERTATVSNDFPFHPMPSEELIDEEEEEGIETEDCDISDEEEELTPPPTPQPLQKPKPKKKTEQKPEAKVNPTQLGLSLDIPDSPAPKPPETPSKSWYLTPERQEKLLNAYTEILEEAEILGKYWTRHTRIGRDVDKAVEKCLESRFGGDAREFFECFCKALRQVPHNSYWRGHKNDRGKFQLINLLNSQNKDDKDTMVRLAADWDAGINHPSYTPYTPEQVQAAFEEDRKRSDEAIEKLKNRPKQPRTSVHRRMGDMFSKMFGKGNPPKQENVNPEPKNVVEKTPNEPPEVDPEKLSEREKEREREAAEREHQARLLQIGTISDQVKKLGGDPNLVLKDIDEDNLFARSEAICAEFKRMRSLNKN